MQTFQASYVYLRLKTRYFSSPLLSTRANIIKCSISSFCYIKELTPSLNNKKIIRSSTSSKVHTRFSPLPIVNKQQSIKINLLIEITDQYSCEVVTSIKHESSRFCMELRAEFFTDLWTVILFSPNKYYGSRHTTICLILIKNNCHKHKPQSYLQSFELVSSSQPLIPLARYRSVFFCICHLS